MIELQLLRIKNNLPMLLLVIDQAIQSVYRRIDEETKTKRTDPLVKSKIGYAFYMDVEHGIRTAIEEACIPEVEARIIRNGSGMPNLQIVTPYAKLMFSRVKNRGDVPRKAKFRQEFIDQMFLPDVVTDYAPYTPDCNALYIITHSGSREDQFKPVICVGRMTEDQEGWSCHYDIQDLTGNAYPVENIVSESQIIPHEEIKRKSRIRIK